MAIEFIDLNAQQERIRDKINGRIAAVLEHGQFIMGPEVAEFETALSNFCGARHSIGCANGTDALQLALMALGVGVGDAVFVPSFTFASTAEVVPCTGAVPVFVDIDLTTYNMDTCSLKRSVRQARMEGLRPAVVIPVDLFGLPADYDAVTNVARNEGMKVIGDSAQSFGALYKGRMTGTLADITTTSFFPAKPLGCYGDGGAVFTDDDDLANLIESLRIHGKGKEKYENVRVGINSRLDTLQAAILLEKLAIYADEIKARQAVAERYTDALSSHFAPPLILNDCSSVWAQYTLAAKTKDAREAVRQRLADNDIPSAVYYPRPLHLQTAYRNFPADPHGLFNSARASETVFSIPMHPYLDVDTQAWITDVLTGKRE